MIIYPQNIYHGVDNISSIIYVPPIALKRANRSLSLLHDISEEIGIDNISIHHGRLSICHNNDGTITLKYRVPINGINDIYVRATSNVDTIRILKLPHGIFVAYEKPGQNEFIYSKLILHEPYHARPIEWLIDNGYTNVILNFATLLMPWAHPDLDTDDMVRDIDLARNKLRFYPFYSVGEPGIRPAGKGTYRVLDTCICRDVADKIVGLSNTAEILDYMVNWHALYLTALWYLAQRISHYKEITDGKLDYFACSVGVANTVLEIYHGLTKDLIHVIKSSNTCRVNNILALLDRNSLSML